MAGKGDMKKKLKELQNIVGSKPKMEVSEFSNWAKTQIRNEIFSVNPTTVEEVQAVVRAARQLGIRVRAAGKTHTWTPLYSDEGDIVMYVKELKRPDGPQLELTQNLHDKESKLLTVATGVTVKEFMDFELSHGVCIPANVVLRVVQMGGVVAPACHGVGWDVKTVSDDVVSMRIIDSNGDLRTYSLEEDEDMMRAVQANLGLWGIIVDLTFKVKPMVIVETKNVWMKVKDIFYNKENLRKTVTENESVEIFWFPFNGISGWEALEAFMEGEIDVGDWDPMDDEVWLRIVNAPDEVGDVEPPVDYEIMNLKDFLQQKGFQLVDGFISNHPQVAPCFLKTQVQQLQKQYSGTHIQQLPHAVHFRGSNHVVPVYDMEWSFNVDNDFSNICTAIQHVVDLVYKEALDGRFPMNLPLEMRFLKSSDVYLSPCGGSKPEYGGSGHTCAMEVLTVAETPGWHEFCQKVANVWQTMQGARPHWCKEWSFLEGIDEFIHKSYDPVLPKYLNALERSDADPDGIFFNDRLEKILYPQGHPGWAKVKATRAKGGKGAKKGATADRQKAQKSRTCQLL